MAIIEHTFRIQPALWDFGTDIGSKWTLCYHAWINAAGAERPLSDTNGTSWQPFIPGPTIRGNVGDTVRITIQNRIKLTDQSAVSATNPNGNLFVDSVKPQAIVHWHGVELSNAHDGTPVTQRPTQPGEDRIYKFKLINPGVFWYHPHFNGLVQEHLGSYGPIIVEDAPTAALRTAKAIPHQDRTFNICLSDVSFQNGRVTGIQPSTSLSPHVPNVSGANSIQNTADVFIRDIQKVSGNENFGDVPLVNGIHATAFNTTGGNTRQLWGGTAGTTPPVITAQQGESMAFHLLNTGLHRFYKIELVFKTTANGAGAWQTSEDLFWIGGQGGMLDKVRRDVHEPPVAPATTGVDTYDDWRLRGREGRNVLGAQVEQTTSELHTGEYVLPTSARMTLAFTVGANWTRVGLRTSGFSVVSGGGGTAGSVLPNEMIIAEFNVGSTPNNNFVLTHALADGADLLTNATVFTTPTPQVDLRTATNVITAFSGCDKTTMDGNGVPVPTGTLLTDYAPKLTRNLNAGGNGPSIDGEQVHFHHHGPFQPTGENVRYVKKGDVVEWTVETTTSNTDHPWHMHGFSFQPIKMELKLANNTYQTLFTWDFVEYVDSIYVPAFHRLTFRFKIHDRKYIAEDNQEHDNGVIGRWLAHCHITKHAHRGMMMNFIAVDNCSYADFQHVDVFMRDKISDTGDTPQTGVVSASPDIRIHKTSSNPNDAFGPNSGTEAEFGSDNFVFARIHNRGNRMARASADIYWSRASTLVTPDVWVHIGRTNTIDVASGSSAVSNALTWDPQDDGAAVGHYCFVGVVGSEQDERPISPELATDYLSFANFDDFITMIRNDNNVVWRNFNVVDLLANAQPDDDEEEEGAEKSAGFDMRGAFDDKRRFDLTIGNPFDNVAVYLPKAQEIIERLTEQKLKFEMLERRIMLFPEAGKTTRIRNLLLEKGRDYHVRFDVRDKAAAMFEKEIWFAQEFVNENRDEQADLADRLASAREAGNKEGAQDLAQKLEALIAESHPDAAERIEVGRVTWRFVDGRKAAPERPSVGILCRLHRCLCRLLGCK